VRLKFNVQGQEQTMSSWKDQYQTIADCVIVSDGVNDASNDKYSNSSCGCVPGFPGDAICKDHRCINFATQVECGRCKEGCCNKRIQNRQYAKLDVIETPGKGHGLFAAEPLKKHQFVMEYVGELISADEFTRRSTERGKLMEHQYIMQLKNGVYLDAGRKGSISRFINHSCEPNCYVEVWTVQGRLRVGIFTMCALSTGDELTFDYQWRPSSRPPTKCHCGTESCRGYLEVFSRDELEALKVRKGLWRKGGEPIASGRQSPRPNASSQSLPRVPSVGAVNVPITADGSVAPSPPNYNTAASAARTVSPDADAAARASPTDAAHSGGTSEAQRAASLEDVYDAQGLLVPAKLIGRRVKVWWQGNLAYLEAEVESYNAKTNKFLCR
jgi:hypothetical protein